MVEQVRIRGGRRAAGAVLAALLCAAGCSAPADRAPDPATRVVMEALMQEVTRLIQESRWEAELLLPRP